MSTSRVCQEQPRNNEVAGVWGLSREPRCTRGSPGDAPWGLERRSKSLVIAWCSPTPHPVLNTTDEGPTGQCVVSSPLAGLGLGYRRGPGEKAIRAFTSPPALPEVTSEATPSSERVPSPPHRSRRTARHPYGPALPANLRPKHGVPQLRESVACSQKMVFKTGDFLHKQRNP